MTKPTTYAEAAQYYLSIGWKPIPLPPRAKKFPPSGCTGYSGTVTPEKIAVWTTDKFWGSGNIALRMEGVLGVDVDDHDEKHGAETLHDTQESVGIPLPPTYSSSARPWATQSRINYYRVPEKMLFDKDAGPDIDLIQFSHRYAVVYPSIHPDTGSQYIWYDPEGLPCMVPPVSALTPLPQEYIDLWSRGNPRPHATGVDGRNPEDVDFSAWLSSLSEGVYDAEQHGKIHDNSDGEYDSTNIAIWEVVAKAERSKGSIPGLRQLYNDVIGYRLESTKASTPVEDRLTDTRRSTRGAIAKIRDEIDEEQKNPRFVVPRKGTLTETPSLVITTDPPKTRPQEINSPTSTPVQNPILPNPSLPTPRIFPFSGPPALPESELTDPAKNPLLDPVPLPDFESVPDAPVEITDRAKIPFLGASPTTGETDIPTTGASPLSSADTTPPENRAFDVQKALVSDGATNAPEGMVRTTPTYAALPEFVQNDPPSGNSFNPKDEPYDPERAPNLKDNLLSEWVGHRQSESLCWVRGLGWLLYDGRVWEDISDVAARELIRQELVNLWEFESRHTGDPARIKQAVVLLDGSKVNNITTGVKGILEKKVTQFDMNRNYLNVGNGVVNLRTGELYPHNPEFRFTKITKVNYYPDATHPDWTKALEAFPATIAEYMQERFGQAATGWPTQDDVMPVLAGDGANGKSTIVKGVQKALGKFASAVPDSVLLANQGQHPTDMTTLQGCRFAIMEETPETRFLNVKRLKDVMGAEQITARKIGENFMTWDCTHSMMLTTNYPPQIAETDYGTWRRLALVNFPYKYVSAAEATGAPHEKPADGNLRARIFANTDGQQEAILAWIVKGAMRWYARGRILPDRPDVVVQDTQKWKGDTDQIFGYLQDNIIFDPESKVLSAELLVDFNKWMKQHGHNTLSDQTFSARMATHDEITSRNIIKGRTESRKGLSRPKGDWMDNIKDPGKKFAYWPGMRFVLEYEEPSL